MLKVRKGACIFNVFLAESSVYIFVKWTFNVIFLVNHCDWFSRCIGHQLMLKTTTWSAVIMINQWCLHFFIFINVISNIEHQLKTSNEYCWKKKTNKENVFDNALWESTESHQDFILHWQSELYKIQKTTNANSCDNNTLWYSLNIRCAVCNATHGLLCLVITQEDYVENDIHAVRWKQTNPQHISDRYTSNDNIWQLLTIFVNNKSTEESAKFKTALWRFWLHWNATDTKGHKLYRDLLAERICKGSDYGIKYWLT